jgi:hypothetical protein
MGDSLVAFGSSGVDSYVSLNQGSLEFTSWNINVALSEFIFFSCLF